MKIYTKQGDRGQSRLFDGTHVPKSHPRLEAYGTVDELNSHVGLVLASLTTPQEPLRAPLLALQAQLLNLGADLATPAGAKNESKIPRITPADTQGLEEQIDTADALLPPLKHFILPGGTEAAASLHVARTVCRRAERLLVALHEAEGSALNAETIIFVNRLSDLLFTWARLANHFAGVAENEWLGKM